MKRGPSGFKNFRRAIMTGNLIAAEKLIDGLAKEPDGVIRLQKICRTAMTQLYGQIQPDGELRIEGEEAGGFATWVETYITPLLTPSPHPTWSAAMSIFLDPQSPLPQSNQMQGT